MSGLDNLNTRLRYAGGNAEGRFINDKLESLRDALLYSYQAETAILEDGREFRCLINPNKETGDYDDKILSMPYEDVCLNKPIVEHDKPGENNRGREATGIKCGDVITWKETNTHWLVFLEYLEENAYFRAQIRKCEYQIEVEGKKYWVYIRGPVETKIIWNQKGGVEWNDLNYSLIMYIKKDDITEEYFHRFTKVKVTNPATDKKENWQVANANPYYGDNMIQVFMTEDFTNTIEDKVLEEKNQNENSDEKNPNTNMKIIGPSKVTEYSTVTYSVENKPVDSSGVWIIDNKVYGAGEVLDLKVNKKADKNQNAFVLEYRSNTGEIVSKEIKFAMF